MRASDDYEFGPKSRQPQSVPTMPTSLWLNHLSDHLLVQLGITRGVSQKTSLLQNGLFRKLGRVGDEGNLLVAILCWQHNLMGFEELRIEGGRWR